MINAGLCHTLLAEKVNMTKDLCIEVKHLLSRSFVTFCNTFVGKVLDRRLCLSTETAIVNSEPAQKRCSDFRQKACFPQI